MILSPFRTRFPFPSVLTAHTFFDLTVGQFSGVTGQIQKLNLVLVS